MLFQWAGSSSDSSLGGGEAVDSSLCLLLLFLPLSGLETEEGTERNKQYGGEGIAVPEHGRVSSAEAGTSLGKGGTFDLSPQVPGGLGAALRIRHLLKFHRQK